MLTCANDMSLPAHKKSVADEIEHCRIGAQMYPKACSPETNNHFMLLRYKSKNIWLFAQYFSVVCVSQSSKFEFESPKKKFFSVQSLHLYVVVHPRSILFVVASLQYCTIRMFCGELKVLIPLSSFISSQTSRSNYSAIVKRHWS